MTISKAISDARRIIPELPFWEALDYANTVHAEVIAQIPSLAKDISTVPVEIALAVGTKEYDLPITSTQISHASIAGSAITPVTVEMLDGLDSTWRTKANDTPTSFYITTNAAGEAKIGLHPTPKAIATLKLYGSSLASLTPKSTISELLPTAEAYVAGIVYYASTRYRPLLTSVYQAAYGMYIDQAKSMSAKKISMESTAVQ